jgi:hypothetical protein
MSMLDGTQPGGLTIANHCTMFWNPAGTVNCGYGPRRHSPGLVGASLIEDVQAAGEVSTS